MKPIQNQFPVPEQPNTVQTNTANDSRRQKIVRNSGRLIFAVGLVLFLSTVGGIAALFTSQEQNIYLLFATILVTLQAVVMVVLGNKIRKSTDVEISSQLVNKVFGISAIMFAVWLVMSFFGAGSLSFPGLMTLILTVYLLITQFRTKK